VSGRGFIVGNIDETCPTENQMKAIKKLEAAFKACRKAHVIIHNVLGTYTFNC